MTKNSMRVLILVLSVLFAWPVFAESAAAKNVIIMIADGMGYNHAEAASLYRFGERRGQVYWSFQHTAMSTWSMNNEDGYDPESAWSDFDYFGRKPTDSAAAGTALSTGHKTRNGMINLTPDGERLRMLMDDSEAMGKSTGVLSTVRFSHATPAAFATRQDARGKEEDIARRMILESPLEVIIGPGHPWYDNDGKQVGGFPPDLFETDQKYDYVGGIETWRLVRDGMAGADANGDGTEDRWTLVDSTAGLAAIAGGESVPARLLGVVPVHTTLQYNRGGDVDAAAFEVPFTPDMPDMAMMVTAALRVLGRNSNGFLLMAEGGAVDWASHGNRSGRMIEEMTDFDKAVEAVMEWVEANSNWQETVLFVTADHECGYLCGPGSDPDWEPLTDNGRGRMPGMEWKSKGHTNQLVPLFAKGAEVERLMDHVRGTDPRHGPFVDNTDIPKVIRTLWGR